MWDNFGLFSTPYGSFFVGVFCFFAFAIMAMMVDDLGSGNFSRFVSIVLKVVAVLSLVVGTMMIGG